jgi:hypothetical protein
MADSKISALTSATTPLAGTETLPVVQSSTTKQVSVANLTAGRAVSASSLSASTGNIEVASTSGYLRVNGQFGGTANGNILVNIGTGQNLIVAETAANIYTVGYGAAGGVPTKITDFEVSTKDTRSYGNFVPNTAAKGVNFTANTPAAGMTSQLLNWYEEGTWTPVIGGDSGQSGQTYSASSFGKYTRIGRQVTLTFQVKLSAKGTISGTYVQLKGFPFSSMANGSSAAAFGYYANLSANFQWVGAYIDPSSNVAYVTGNKTAASTIGYLAPADITDTTTFTGALTYFV